MKTLSRALLGAIIAASLPISGAFAGINYSQNHDQFRAEKQTKDTSADKGRSFEHRSKYQRGQEMQDNTLPTRERNLNQVPSRSGGTK